MAAVTWFQRRLAYRPGATRLNEAMLYGETVGSAAPDSTSANPFRRRIAGSLAAGA